MGRAPPGRRRAGSDRATTRGMRRRWLVYGVIGALGLPVAAWLGLVGFANLALPGLLSTRPERLQVDWSDAWITPDGAFSLRRLEVRVQSRADQWALTADAVSGTLDLPELLDRHLSAHGLTVDGVTFRHRRRADAPGGGSPTDPALLAPIGGLANPPDPAPEFPEVANPWHLTFTNVRMADVHEVWVDRWRYEGDLWVTGSLDLTPGHAVVLTGGQAWFGGGRVEVADAPVATGIRGRLDADIAGMDPGDSDDVWAHLAAAADARGQVEDLGFLDPWLRDVPWLHVGGRADELRIDAKVVGGHFLPGSALTAVAHDLDVQFLSYRIQGDGTARLAVEPGSPDPYSQLSVRFRDYRIVRDGGDAPLVRGRGFAVTARSEVVALHQPLGNVSLVLDLPESEIPDARLYNAYLPSKIGFALTSGRGRVSGRMEASIPDAHARGELTLHGDAVRATFDDFAFSGDVTLRAHLAEGVLDRGVYDMAESRLELRDVRVETGMSATETMVEVAELPVAAAPEPADDPREEKKARRREKKAERGAPKSPFAAADTPKVTLPRLVPKRSAVTPGWWATLIVPACRVEAGAAVFLDATALVALRDTVPFLTVFSRKHPLPTWLKEPLAIRDVGGTAHLRLGDSSLDIPEFNVRAAGFDVRMRLRRAESTFRGVLLAEYKTLALGLELVGDRVKPQLANPRAWFDAYGPLDGPAAP